MWAENIPDWPSANVTRVGRREVVDQPQRQLNPIPPPFLWDPGLDHLLDHSVNGEHPATESGHGIIGEIRYGLPDCCGLDLLSRLSAETRVRLFEDLFPFLKHFDRNRIGRQIGGQAENGFRGQTE